MAEREGRPFLTWRGADRGQQIRNLAADHWRVTVGRDAGADLCLEWDHQISRSHAVLERVGEAWTLVDDGLSRNGSFVNGARVVGRRRLNDGDRLCFGATEVTYREPAAQSPLVTASVSDGLEARWLSPMQRKVLIALCRPVHASEMATPATNRQIAEEVHLTVAAVKAHLRVLFDRYGLADLRQNEKRAQLVMNALVSGTVTPRDF
jgi:FHA domain-containing protein